MQLLTSRLCGVNIKAIEIANDLNRDFELGGPVITMEGILTDDKAECQALFDRLSVELEVVDKEMDLDKMKSISRSGGASSVNKNDQTVTTFQRSVYLCYRCE
jgi:hypothetical protein